MKRFGTTLGLLLFGVTIILPIVWVVMTSFKSGPEIFANPWALPKGLRTENYVNAWQEAGIGRSFVNSLIACVGTLVILIPIGAMAAYVLARFPFKGSQLIFGTFAGGMMFPQFLTIVPLFLLINKIRLFDTMFGLILVYVAYSLSFTVFVLHGFFQALPAELSEAAEMDGCSHSAAFWRVMLPLAKPGILVVGIFNAIGLWNEYGLALVLLPSKNNHTLPLGLANLTVTQQYQSDWGALFAALTIVMIPILLVYWLLRDRIQEAMLAGAIKG